jgi:spermidine/putrescine transport system substrate-binding protein
MRKLLNRWTYLVTASLSIALTSVALADDNVVNVYTWSGVIPAFALRQFEQETGIKVNFSTYDSNEVMFAKLKADKNTNYDVVEPSSYYIDRMRRQQMLEKLDKNKLANMVNINPSLLKEPYDPTSSYSIPFIWGVTGIFVNKEYYAPNSIKNWTDLWDKKYAGQILMLNDSREVFSMAMLVLGYSANDGDPQHIQQAYEKLKEILPNVKIFNSAILSLLIDEDATIGMAWNGDLFKAKKENSQLEFIYPHDGFVIWVDTFAIPKNAPHLDNAYKFLNFMMRADVAKAVALDNNFPTANLAAEKLLPESVQKNSTIYPSNEVIHRGQFQTDLSDQALSLYESYWERLKMEG